MSVCTWQLNNRNPFCTPPAVKNIVLVRHKTRLQLLPGPRELQHHNKHCDAITDRLQLHTLSSIANRVCAPAKLFPQFGIFEFGCDFAELRHFLVIQRHSEKNNTSNRLVTIATVREGETNLEGPVATADLVLVAILGAKYWIRDVAAVLN